MLFAIQILGNQLNKPSLFIVILIITSLIICIDSIEKVVYQKLPIDKTINGFSLICFCLSSFIMYSQIFYLPPDRHYHDYHVHDWYFYRLFVPLGLIFSLTGVLINLGLLILLPYLKNKYYR